MRIIVESSRVVLEEDSLKRARRMFPSDYSRRDAARNLRVNSRGNEGTRLVTSGIAVETFRARSAPVDRERLSRLRTCRTIRIA